MAPVRRLTARIACCRHSSFVVVFRRSSAADHRNVNQLKQYPISDLFSYHVGPVYGLSADVSSARRLAVSVGDDKDLMVWDTVNSVTIARGNVKSPSRCYALDRMLHRSERHGR